MRPFAKRFRPRSLELFNGSYNREQFGVDIGAGVTVGLIALPLALALGVASVPAGVATPFPAPAVGLFTAIIAGLIVSVFGGSRVQIAGPTAAFMPIVLLVIERYGFDGLLLATIMAGVILIIMGLARIGSLIKFIPYPVTSGFTTGIAVSIMMSQAPDLLGIKTSEPAPREFIEKIGWLARHVGDSNPLTLVTAFATGLIIFLWPRLGWRRVPGMVVAMVVASIAVSLLGWAHHHGVDTPAKVMLPAGESILTVRSIRNPTQAELDRLLTEIKPPEFEE